VNSDDLPRPKRFRTSDAIAVSLILAFSAIIGSVVYCNTPTTPPAPPPITPIGAACNDVCATLGLRQIAHDRVWIFPDNTGTGIRGYECVCLSRHRSCRWVSDGTITCAEIQ
jgi:hypothetical protein